MLEDCVDIIHFAQPLKEGDEVQQLGVGHVIEPRGHRHLGENTEYQQPHQQHCFYVTVIFSQYTSLYDLEIFFNKDE